jgi:inhibitor of the pro-sigma K processing machinery
VRALFKLIFNAVIGGIVLVIINFIGGFLSFHIGLNIITAVIVGLMGIPGVILLIALHFLSVYSIFYRFPLVIL